MFLGASGFGDADSSEARRRMSRSCRRNARKSATLNFLKSSHRSFLVREAVVADLAAVARLDQVFEVLRDLLGVFVRVKFLRERRHGARHGVERGADFPEREVVVVGEAVELLLRLVGEARVNAREGWRDFHERLENALVAEVVRHERHEVGLRVLEAEPVEKPSEVRLRDRHIRRPERTADQEHRCRH